MAINTQKFLPSSKGGALSKVNNSIIKGSSSIGFTNKSVENLGIIRIKVIQIDDILKGTLAADKKKLTEEKKKESYERREKIEEKIETKPNAEKGKIKMPRLPRMGFLDWVKNFIGNIILGYFAVRLVDHLPKIIPIVKFLGKATDFVLGVGGKLLDGLVTFIDWGYKAYDATRGFIKNLFGDDGVKQFDQLSKTLNQFLNLALIAGMTVAGSGGFGGGKGRGTAVRPGGKPKVTTTGGRTVGRPDVRNPFRQRPKVTVGRGGNRALLSSVRPFLKRIPLPVVGALIDFGLSVALGENPGRAAFRAIGAGLLGAVGAAAGTVVPVAGNFIGGLLGGAAGDAIGGVLYDFLFGGKSSSAKGKTVKKAGGGITRAGRPQRGVKRTLTTRVKYKRKLAPKKPGDVEATSPGSDVGGEEKLFGLFPNPFKMMQKVTNVMNPFKVIQKAGQNLGDSDYFGPILAITSKILLGQKPTQEDYKNVGLGINMLVAKGIDAGKLKGGLAAFAEGGFVDPKTLDAIAQGGDISDWVARSFKDATESNTQKTLREIQENLRLQKGKDESQGKTGPESGGGMAGEFSPEGLQGDIYKYLLSKGMDDFHALGIMANIHRESGFKPGVSEYGGPGVGLFQYSSGGRKDSFLKSVPDYKTNWKGQIDFALKDDVGPQYLTIKFNSAQEASDWWMRKWERPAEYIQRDKGPKIHAQYLASLEKFRTSKGYKIPTSGDYAGMDRGSVGGAIAEYITGDPNTPFGRFDRSGHGLPSNYHDHIAFRDRNTAVKAYKFFQSKGIQVTEFKGFNSVGGHAPGSYHYSGLAFDVPGAQWGGSGAIGSKDYAGSARVRKTLKEFLGGSVAKFEKGGMTLERPHLAILGEKGKEFVIDADSTAAIEGTFPGFLDAINKAKYKDAINVLSNFASYESGSEQIIIVADTQVIAGSGDAYEGGGGLMISSNESESDPFDSLYVGG